MARNNLYHSWKYLVYLLTLCPQCNASSPQIRRIDPEVQKELDFFIEKEFLPKSEISGLGLSIVQNDGQLLYATGYGLANREKGILISNSTQFILGSLTKSFTALLTVKLLHQNFPSMGEAVLDTPIRELLPQANFTLVDQFRSEQVTFRDLMAHRLCLRAQDVQLLADPFNSTEEITYRTRYMEEECGVRGDFVYSNHMYVLVGELAGLLAKKSYQDAVEELLNDIGMTDSSFIQMTDDFEQMPFRAMPYYVKEGETHPYNPELVKRVVKYSSAGGLFVTPADMIKYAQFHLNLGAVNGKQVVSPDVVEWLRKPSNLGPTPLLFKKLDDDLIVNEIGYGLGLVVASYDGWYSIRHGGRMIPYTCMLSLYPDKELGIFTGTNMGPERVSQQDLHSFIFEILNGNRNPMKLKRFLKTTTETISSSYPTEFHAIHQSQVKEMPMNFIHQIDIVGKYGSGSLGDAEVTERYNEQTNKTEYYFVYGRWYKGWLQETLERRGRVFRLVYDTDAIQDEYYMGYSLFVEFDNDGTMKILLQGENQKVFEAKFKLGVRLDTLPRVPWSVKGCKTDSIL